jgi:hypothetical protein
MRRLECFIAYSEAYRPFAELILRIVESLSATATLFDGPHDGAGASAEAKRRIDRADFVVALLGPTAARSGSDSKTPTVAPYPKSEADYAMGRTKPMAVIVHRGTTTPLHDDRVPVEVDFWDVTSITTQIHHLNQAIGAARNRALLRRWRRRLWLPALTLCALVLAMAYGRIDRAIVPATVTCRDLAKFLVLDGMGEIETPPGLPTVSSPFAAMALECDDHQANGDLGGTVGGEGPIRLVGYRISLNEVYAPGAVPGPKTFCGDWAYRSDVVLTLGSSGRSRGRLEHSKIERVGLLSTAERSGATAPHPLCPGAATWLPDFERHMRDCTAGGTLICDARVLTMTDLLGISVRRWVVKTDDCVYAGCDDIRPSKTWTFAERARTRHWWERIPAFDSP